MSGTVTKSWSSAGYLPGQTIKVTVAFKSRDVNTVTVTWKLYAKDNGSDPYTYNQRHNKATIYIGNETVTTTYQVRHGDSMTKSGTKVIYGVKNGVTSLSVAFKNQRVWVDGKNASDPRSTGVVSKTTIGTLTFSDNVQYVVTYFSGYTDGNITGRPNAKVTVYKGTSITIPTNVLIDNDNHYVFNNGYSTSFTGPVNTVAPTAKIGMKQVINGRKDYYACWKTQNYLYTFFTDNTYAQEYTNLSIDYSYASSSAVLPDLNILSNNNTSSEYYKKGYKFSNWRYIKNSEIIDAGTTCNEDYPVRFYPKWDAIKGKINFDYGYDSIVRTYDYTYNTNYDLNNLCLDKDGIFKSNTLIRPGYRLVGWAYEKPSKIYYPFETSNTDYNFKFDYNGTIDFINDLFTNNQFENTGITLYAVWEYFTTVYVYTNNSWKLALPYVYTDGKWKMCLTYGRVGGAEPSWKL